MDLQTLLSQCRSLNPQDIADDDRSSDSTYCDSGNSDADGDDDDEAITDDSPPIIRTRPRQGVGKVPALLVPANQRTADVHPPCNSEKPLRSSVNGTVVNWCSTYPHLVEYIVVPSRSARKRKIPYRSLDASWELFRPLELCYEDLKKERDQREARMFQELDLEPTRHGGGLFPSFEAFISNFGTVCFDARAFRALQTSGTDVSQKINPHPMLNSAQTPSTGGPLPERTVLGAALASWKQFKDQHQDIAEELQEHHRGNTFLAQQAFLERVAEVEQLGTEPVSKRLKSL